MAKVLVVQSQYFFFVEIQEARTRLKIFFNSFIAFRIISFFFYFNKSIVQFHLLCEFEWKKLV